MNVEAREINMINMIYAPSEIKHYDGHPQSNEVADRLSEKILKGTNTMYEQIVEKSPTDVKNFDSMSTYVKRIDTISSDIEVRRLDTDAVNQLQSIETIVTNVQVNRAETQNLKHLNTISDALEVKSVKTDSDWDQHDWDHHE